MLDEYETPYSSFHIDSPAAGPGVMGPLLVRESLLVPTVQQCVEQASRCTDVSLQKYSFIYPRRIIPFSSTLSGGNIVKKTYALNNALATFMEQAIDPFPTDDQGYQPSNIFERYNIQSFSCKGTRFRFTVSGSKHNILNVYCSRVVEKYKLLALKRFPCILTNIECNDTGDIVLVSTPFYLELHLVYLRSPDTTSALNRTGDRHHHRHSSSKQHSSNINELLTAKSSSRHRRHSSEYKALSRRAQECSNTYAFYRLIRIINTSEGICRTTMFPNCGTSGSFTRAIRLVVSRWDSSFCCYEISFTPVKAKLLLDYDKGSESLSSNGSTSASLPVYDVLVRKYSPIKLTNIYNPVLQEPSRMFFGSVQFDDFINAPALVSFGNIDNSVFYAIRGHAIYRIPFALSDTSTETNIPMHSGSTMGNHPASISESTVAPKDQQEPTLSHYGCKSACSVLSPGPTANTIVVADCLNVYLYDIRNLIQPILAVAHGLSVEAYPHILHSYPLDSSAFASDIAITLRAIGCDGLKRYHLRNPREASSNTFAVIVVGNLLSVVTLVIGTQPNETRGVVFSLPRALFSAVDRPSCTRPVALATPGALYGPFAQTSLSKAAIANRHLASLSNMATMAACTVTDYETLKLYDYIVSVELLSGREDPLIFGVTFESGLQLALSLNLSFDNTKDTASDAPSTSDGKTGELIMSYLQRAARKAARIDNARSNKLMKRIMKHYASCSQIFDECSIIQKLAEEKRQFTIHSVAQELEPRTKCPDSSATLLPQRLSAEKLEELYLAIRAGNGYLQGSATSMPPAATKEEKRGVLSQSQGSPSQENIFEAFSKNLFNSNKASQPNKATKSRVPAADRHAKGVLSQDEPLLSQLFPMSQTSIRKTQGGNGQFPTAPIDQDANSDELAALDTLFNLVSMQPESEGHN